MKPLTLLLAFCLSCMSLPHVEPQLRTTQHQFATLVSVDAYCSDPDPFRNPEPGRSSLDHPIHWGQGHGVGVIISEAHVLTAAHVVGCGPTIPRVVVTLSSGRHLRMVVERDDRMFGKGRDLARLVMASGSTFDLNIAPPTLATAEPDDAVTLGNARGTARGQGEIVRVTGARVGPGWSGVPVYRTDGALLGIVTGGDTDAGFVKYEPLDASWLKGT